MTFGTCLFLAESFPALAEGLSGQGKGSPGVEFQTLCENGHPVAGEKDQEWQACGGKFAGGS